MQLLDRFVSVEATQNTVPFFYFLMQGYVCLVNKLSQGCESDYHSSVRWCCSQDSPVSPGRDSQPHLAIRGFDEPG